MNRSAEQSAPFQGQLGETTTSKVPITTDSGEVFRAEVYTTVNVSDDPSLREDLVEGTLNLVEAPNGDRTYEPAVSVRYHDEENRVFALVIPNELRHRAFELRSELLEELAEVDVPIPDYVADFATVFDPGRLEQLEETGTARTFEPTSTTELQDRAEETTSGDGTGQVDEIEREWEEIEEARRELDQREEQLDEVHERIDRERRQMDEVEQELAAEREELEQLREELEAEREQLEADRQALEAERLKVEEESRRAEREEPEVAEEVTQVVTDDQFVEVAEEPADDSVPAPSEFGAESEPEVVSGESTEILEAPMAADGAGLQPDLGVVVDETDVTALPNSFDDERAGGLDGYLDLTDGQVTAFCRLSGDELELFDGGVPKFFVQYHEVDEVPIAALTLAALDEDESVEQTFGWPLNLEDETHAEIFEQLEDEFELKVGLYGEDGAAVEAYRVSGPLEENLQWIRGEVESKLEDLEDETFEIAAELFTSEEFQRVGEMRHNFERDAFHDLDTSSQVKLAAGVVGFWSEPEQFDYLVANRSYPLLLFRALQEDVVEAAVETGIFLEEQLREIAIEEGIAEDETDLVERQLANFAEVAVQIRENDLDPLDEWENWDALIEFAQQLGVSPDPDVIELAEASLQRARDYQETQQAVEPDGESGGQGAGTNEEPGAVEVDDELVVSKRSEATGVTYFVPDDAVIDSFDDLADVPREDLEKLLDDPNGRLEAAQMLVERFSSEVVSTVLDAAERMAAPEVTALARFLETKADGLEPELVRAVESGGPSAMYVAARALAVIESTSALPTLVEAYRDSERQFNRQAMAEALASYGEKLVPAVTRSLREEGGDDDMVTLLAQLQAQTDEDVLEELVDEPDEVVREVAERARNQRM
jgi:hypothetical protein